MVIVSTHWFSLSEHSHEKPIHEWATSRAVVEFATKPYEDRLDRAIWRGTQTGGLYTQETWTQFARSRLVLFSQQHPDVVDARFSGFSQVIDEAKDAILHASALRN